MTGGVVVVDYGMGNLVSVSNALGVLGVRHQVSADPATVATAAGLVLPGVGAFGAAMTNLKSRNLIAPMTERVKAGFPFLGICLGMQLLARTSDEKGRHDGLGWLDGHVKAIIPAPGVQVPHVGWTGVAVDSNDPLFHRLGGCPTFYFDHSYHLACESSAVIGTFDHGGRLVATVRAGNVYGVQFHPEKSQRDGLVMLRNFTNLVAAWAAEASDA